MTSSWWLKYRRAEFLGRELVAMISSATQDQPIRIEKVWDVDAWSYSVHHDIDLPESFTVVLGDFLFNLRSALDHVAAEHQKRRSSKTPFPIFHEMPAEGTQPAKGTRLAAYKKAWDAVRANTQPDVFAVMESAQPFNCGPEFEPVDAALTILNELHNRDKHASLAVITTGVADIQSTIVAPDGSRALIPGPDLANGFFPNGARIFHIKDDLTIEATGRVAIAVAAGPTGTHRPLPESLRDIAGEVEAVLVQVDQVVADRK